MELNLKVDYWKSWFYNWIKYRGNQTSFKTVLEDDTLDTADMVTHSMLVTYED